MAMEEIKKKMLSAFFLFIQPDSILKTVIFTIYSVKF